MLTINKLQVTARSSILDNVNKNSVHVAHSALTNVTDAEYGNFGQQQQLTIFDNETITI